MPHEDREGGIRGGLERGGGANRERIERVKGEHGGAGLSLGLLPVLCLEAPLCSEMRIAVCT